MNKIHLTLKTRYSSIWFVKGVVNTSTIRTATIWTCLEYCCHYYCLVDHSDGQASEVIWSKHEPQWRRVEPWHAVCDTRWELKGWSSWPEIWRLNETCRCIKRYVMLCIELHHISSAQIRVFICMPQSRTSLRMSILALDKAVHLGLFSAAY